MSRGSTDSPDRRECDGYSSGRHLYTTQICVPAHQVAVSSLKENKAEYFDAISGDLASRGKRVQGTELFMWIFHGRTLPAESLLCLFETEPGSLHGWNEVIQGDGMRKKTGTDLPGFSRPFKGLWLLL